MTKWILPIAMMICISCHTEQNVPIPTTTDKSILKTYTEEINLDFEDSLSIKRVQKNTEIALAKMLIALAKNGNIKAYKNVGPWGDELKELGPSEMEDAFLIKKEIEVNGAFELKEFRLSLDELGPMIFNETWEFEEATNTLTKSVNQVTLTELVKDENGFTAGNRNLITFTLGSN